TAPTPLSPPRRMGRRPTATSSPPASREPRDRLRHPRDHHRRHDRHVARRPRRQPRGGPPVSLTCVRSCVIARRHLADCQHADDHDLTPPTDGVAHLRLHLAPVECSAWIADAWAELADLTSRAHALVPWRPEVVKLGAPCPHCHCPALVMYGGDDWVTCQECGGVLERAMYDHWARVILDEQRQAAA